MYVNSYLKIIKNSNIYDSSYSSNDAFSLISIKNSRESYSSKEYQSSLPQQGTFKSFYIFSGLPTQAPSSSYRGFSIYVGTGSILPSVEDVDLESWVDLEFITGSALYNKDSGITTITFVRKNSTQEIITINETCLCVNGAKNYYPVMIARDVLNDPVTLAPGETITITYKIS